MVVYHLHGQTGWFTVWVNGKKNSGLVNLTPDSRFNLYRSVSFSVKRPLKPEPGVKDGFDRSKKCNIPTNFRWKIPLRKTGLTYQTVRCSRKCFTEATYIFCMFSIKQDGAEKMLIRAKVHGNQNCKSGGCHQNCTSEFRCYQSCKGGCPQHCTTGERCEQSCSIDGRCHQSCTSNSCEQRCDKGGNCNMTCKARDRCVQVLNNNNYNNGLYFHQIKIHILCYNCHEYRNT